jgi:phenylalanine-4-hydroxylase
LVDVLRTPYRIDIHQPIYFVIEDFNDVLNAVSGDLLGSIRKAQSLGLFAPTYEALTA